jgi:hypothetical protein
MANWIPSSIVAFSSSLGSFAVIVFPSAYIKRLIQHVADLRAIFAGQYPADGGLHAV